MRWSTPCTVQPPHMPAQRQPRPAKGERRGMALDLLNWPSRPPPPISPEAPPRPPAAPPALPLTAFPFNEHESLGATHWPPGWSSDSRFPWRRGDTNLHGWQTRHTGPTGPPGVCIKDEASRAEYGLTARACGTGYFVFAGGRGELDGYGGLNGTTYSLAYDGRTCSSAGAIIGRIVFKYHMWIMPCDGRNGRGDSRCDTPSFRRLEMGTLRIRASNGTILWSRRGNQGDAWRDAEANAMTSSFSFEYVRAAGWGEPAIADVTVQCVLDVRPPSPPSVPPSPPMPPPAPPVPPSSPPPLLPPRHPPTPQQPPPPPDAPREPVTRLATVGRAVAKTLAATLRATAHALCDGLYGGAALVASLTTPTPDDSTPRAWLHTRAVSLIAHDSPPQRLWILATGLALALATACAAHWCGCCRSRRHAAEFGLAAPPMRFVKRGTTRADGRTVYKSML